MSDPNPAPVQPSTQSLGEQALDQLKAVTGLLQEYLSAQAAGKRKENNWLTVKRAFIATIFVGGLVAYLVFYANLLGIQSDPSFDSVAVIGIEGPIGPDMDASAKNVVPIIERACEASHVDSLLLNISSGGGAPSESERIIAAIEACKVATEDHPAKKVVALIDGVGASAAYMIAMHADEVYAGRYTIVGSIGAIMRLNDASELANKFGLRERAYRTAPLKGGPSLLAGPTPADDAEFQSLVTKMGRQFLDEVVQTRGKKLKLTPDQLFTGQVWTAPEALQIGLIDGMATREDLERTKYKDQKLHDYKTKPSVAEWMGLKAMAHQIVAELRQPSFE